MSDTSTHNHTHRHTQTHTDTHRHTQTHAHEAAAHGATVPSLFRPKTRSRNISYKHTLDPGIKAESNENNQQS